MTLLYAALLVGVVCDTGSSTAHAQAQPPALSTPLAAAQPIPALEPILVEGEALAATPAWTSSTSRKTLDDFQVRGWSDLGKRVEPGVGFNRQNNSINIRGLDAGRVVTRVDGIRLPWLDDGARGVKGGLNAVDFNSLSRLDIVRGADSATAGSGAMGGSANLLTLQPEDILQPGRRFGALTKLDYDSADRSRAANAALAGRVNDDTTWLLQAGGRKGHQLENYGSVGGYGARRSESDAAHYTQQNLLFKLNQRLGAGHRVGLTGEYFDRDTEIDNAFQQGPGTSYLIGENTGHEKIRRERVSLDYAYVAPQSGGLFDTVSAIAYWQRLKLNNGLTGVRSTDARAAIIPRDPFSYGFPSGDYGRSNMIQESVFGVNTEATRRFSSALPQTWTLGAEWIGNRTEQHSAGFDNCPTIRPGTPAPFGPRACDMLHTNQADMPRVKGQQWAVWLKNEVAFAQGRYTLTPALRYDRYKQDPQSTGAYALNANAAGLPPKSSGQRFSPSLLGTWKARDNLSFYAQYAYGFKAPTASQLYTNYGGPGTYLRVGNPYLKPETSRGWELGTRVGDEALGGALSFFDNRYQNFIDNNVPLDPRSPQWQSQWAGQYPLGVTGQVNRSKVRIYGAEAAAHWKFAPGWRTWGGLAWAVGRDERTQQHLNSVAPLKVIAGLGYEQAQWGASALVTAAVRRNKVEYREATSQAPNEDFRAPGYGVVDLMGYWRPAQVKGLQLQAGLYNVFDKKYWEAINVPTAGAIALPRPVDWYTEPGRSARVSLTYHY